MLLVLTGACTTDLEHKKTLFSSVISNYISLLIATASQQLFGCISEPSPTKHVYKLLHTETPIERCMQRWCFRMQFYRWLRGSSHPAHS